VDLLPAQSYFYEHDIFPLAFCRVVSNGSSLEWHLNDSVWSTNYKIPAFKTIHLKINTKKGGSIPKYTDKIKSIVIKIAGDSETIKIQNESESDMGTPKKSDICSLLNDLTFVHGILCLKIFALL
jgi:hypothetical protein